jgi:hypothetical protein
MQDPASSDSDSEDGEGGQGPSRTPAAESSSSDEGVSPPKRVRLAADTKTEKLEKQRNLLLSKFSKCTQALKLPGKADIMKFVDDNDLDFNWIQAKSILYARVQKEKRQKK